MPVLKTQLKPDEKLGTIAAPPPQKSPYDKPDPGITKPDNGETSAQKRARKAAIKARRLVRHSAPAKR